MDKKTSYFSVYEKCLWGISTAVIIIAFFISGSHDIMTLTASLIGASFLILNAKGNVLGQVLTVVFSLIYGIISYRNAYYGEMITYLGMTAPIAVVSVITWLKNPAESGKAEVRVNRLKFREYVFLLFLSIAVTTVFYFILKYFHTGVLWLSTISVFTSFAAAYLTMRRSEYYAIAYAANDVVLIILWSIASARNTEYISVIICFVIFLINDLYGFINWSKLKNKQRLADQRNLQNNA